MDSAIGIVTRDRPEQLDRTLQSIISQSVLPNEILIADDSVSLQDETEELVLEIREKNHMNNIDITYIRQEEGWTLPEARNILLNRSESEIICYVDDDVVCPENWLYAIQQRYESDEDIAAVGGPALKTNDDLEPVSKTIQDGTGRNSINEYGEVTDMSGRWVPPQAVSVPLFRGANMSFKSSKLTAIGGFDPEYKGMSIFEEWDTMTRLYKKGEKLIYDPSSLLYHLETASGGSRTVSSYPGTYWYARNGIRFRKKYVSDVNLNRSLFRFITSEKGGSPSIGQIIRGLSSGDISVGYWLKGYWDGYWQERA
ncbi:glycosyltransferase family 2 protein [Halobellus marinus]|uniref:glycosyltransferase family 2 protein n=1 Tax=Halobellus TaxID=1073986 RepID=UPI0028A598A4|nr:glycosyltransferase [Halobellus sp. DFY28]